MYPAVLLTYFISVAVILLASLALTVHVSLPCNKTERASLLYSFILVYLRVFCGINTLFIISVIFKKLFNNSVKRKAMEDLCERTRELIHKELLRQDLDSLTYVDIGNISRNMHKAGSSQLLPLPTDFKKLMEH